MLLLPKGVNIFCPYLTLPNRVGQHAIAPNSIGRPTSKVADSNIVSEQWLMTKVLGS